jgi:phage tail-like protein
MESGFISGEILTYQDGNDLFLRKRLGRVKYEDIVLTCGANFSIPFYQWLAGTLGQQGPRKNGAIVTVNQNGQIIDRREFQNTLIKEVQFPALDGASNEPAYFTVTLTPERIRYQSASGQAGPPPRADLASLSASRFRLQIQGLEPACAFVQHIDSLVVSQEIISYRDGGTGGESKVRAGRLQVGNVVVTLPQHQAGLFTAWFSDFVLQGQVAGNLKQGTLELLSPDGQSVLATVALGNLGIFRMAPVTVGGASQVQIEMFCETMQLTQFPGSGAGGASQKVAPAQQKAPPPQSKSRILPRTKTLTPRLPQSR